MGNFNCLDVGHGDASIISTDTATFLIDCHNIGDHSSLLPKDKMIKGVFITHQHTDHFSGLSYLLDNNYKIGYIIYSPYERRLGDTSVSLEEWKEFNKLKDNFVDKGTELRTPHREDVSKAYWLTDGVEFRILGPGITVASSDTREIHDASLSIWAKMNTIRCLFSGDASDTNLEDLSSTVVNYCNGILHASHHGSINGAHLEFIKGTNATHTVISAKSGVYDNIPHDTALQRYKDNTKRKVYRTDIDGTLTWTF